MLYFTNSSEVILLNRNTLGTVFICLSALGFGLLPIFATYAYQHQATLYTMLVLRFGIAALVFFGAAYTSLRYLQLTKRDILTLLLLGGVLYTLQASFFLSAVKYIPSSLVSLLLYTYPIIVALLSVLLGREPLSRRLVAAAVIAFLGLILVLNSSVARIDLRGVGLGLGAGVVYSIYILIGSTMVQKVPPLVTSAFVSMFATISLLLMGLTAGSLNFHLDSIAYLAILGVALFSTVLAIFTFFAGVNLIGPVRASILSMIEPLITSGCAFLLFGEQFTWLQALGGLIVLGGGAMVVTEKRLAAEEKNNSEVDV